MRNETSSGVGWLPVLLALAVLCLAGAAALTLLWRSSAPAAVPVEQFSFIMQRTPFEAQNALRGEPSAFDALAKSAARLNSLTANGALAAARVKFASDWSKLNDGVAGVGAARPRWSRFNRPIVRLANWRRSCCRSWATLRAPSACKNSRV